MATWQHTVAREWIWLCAVLLLGTPVLYWTYGEAVYAAGLALLVLYPFIVLVRLTVWAIRSMTFHQIQ